MSAMAILMVLNFSMPGWRIEVGPAVGEYARWTALQLGMSIPIFSEFEGDSAAPHYQHNFTLGLNLPVIHTADNTTNYSNGDVHLHYEFKDLFWMSRERYMFVSVGFGIYARVIYERPSPTMSWSSVRLGFPSFTIRTGLSVKNMEIGVFWHRTAKGFPNFVGISVEFTPSTTGEGK